MYDTSAQVSAGVVVCSPTEIIIFAEYMSTIGYF